MHAFLSLDWFFILTSFAKTLGIIFVIVLPMVSYTVYAERRVSALIQDRLGPNRVNIPLSIVGNFLGREWKDMPIYLGGLGQPIADARQVKSGRISLQRGIRHHTFHHQSQDLRVGPSQLRLHRARRVLRRIVLRLIQMLSRQQQELQRTPHLLPRAVGYLAGPGPGANRISRLALQ